MYSYTSAPGLTYMNPAYSQEILLEGLTRDDSIFRLLPKTTYQSEKDSFHYVAEDVGDFHSILEDAVLHDGTSDIPQLEDVDKIVPATIKIDWKETIQGIELAKISGNNVGPEFVHDYMQELFNTKLEMMLAGVYESSTVHGVDTPATNATSADVECLDRMITDHVELGYINHVSVDIDGDIFWGPTNKTGTDTPRIDRFIAASVWDAQIKLPTTPGADGCEAYDILSEADTLMATMKKYRQGSGPANYIALMGDKALNKVQDEIDPKGMWLEGETNVTQNLNGISTRNGVEGGKLTVASLILSGVKCPVFTAKYLEGTATSSWLWKNSVYTTGGVGNIYLINMDAIEFRTLVPPTAESFRNQAPNAAPGLGYLSHIYMMGQLIIRNWASHGALKYIRS